MSELERLNEDNELLREQVERLTLEKEELLAYICKATEERTRMEEKYKAMETELFRLKTQMDIVNLIFGGK